MISNPDFSLATLDMPTKIIKNQDPKKSNNEAKYV